ncbi:MAG: methyltransferase domain-containing protein [Promethearchaeota archaeon]
MKNSKSTKDIDYMEDIEEFIKNLYQNNGYLKKNPTLHKEDSLWKISKIIPVVNKFFRYSKRDENDKRNKLTLLDAGGGAGLILNGVAAYINEKYTIEIDKYALDLSNEALKQQKKHNPDLKKALNEDIRYTSLKDKEINLALLIDLLEHIPQPETALEEIKRISNFVILKVPLENVFLNKIRNIVTGGRVRKHLIKDIGHINYYNFQILRRQIEKHMGQIIDYSYTNLHAFFFINTSGFRKLFYFILKLVFKITPKLLSMIITDHIMILVKCFP